MKHFVLSISLSGLVIVAVSATAQAAYYHHRHHHYWHHHGYPVAAVTARRQPVEPFRALSVIRWREAASRS